MVVTYAQLVVEVISMENGVVRYIVVFHSDDDLNNWPPISSVVAIMSSVFSSSLGMHSRFAFLFFFSYFFFDRLFILSKM